VLGPYSVEGGLGWKGWKDVRGVAVVEGARLIWARVSAGGEAALALAEGTVFENFVQDVYFVAYCFSSFNGRE